MTNLFISRQDFIYSRRQDCRLQKLHTLSSRLAFLGIMGAQLMAALKPFNTLVLWWSEEFYGAFNWAPRAAERRYFLGIRFIILRFPGWVIWASRPGVLFLGAHFTNKLDFGLFLT